MKAFLLALTLFPTLLSAAEVTALFKGVVVQASYKIQGPTKHKTTTSYPENHPEKGPIFLQCLSDPIEYRNIWVRDLDHYDQQ